jgi:hypothetical protein
MPEVTPEVLSVFVGQGLKTPLHFREGRKKVRFRKDTVIRVLEVSVSGSAVVAKTEGETPYAVVVPEVYLEYTSSIGKAFVSAPVSHPIEIAGANTLEIVVAVPCPPNEPCLLMINGHVTFEFLQGGYFVDQ